MDKKQNWIIYIIRTDCGKLYTGITTDLKRRFEEHAANKGAKFFHTSHPKEIVYQEKCATRSFASKREAEIKKMTRLQKLNLIAAAKNLGQIKLPKTDQALLEECKVYAYRAQGKGGQHVNVTDSAVRLKHLPTGIVVTCQKHRSQYLNKQYCIEKLRKKIESMNKHKKKRIATKISKSQKRKNKASNIKESQKRKLRKNPSWDD